MKKNWVSLLIYTLLTLTLISAACDDLDLKPPKKGKKNDLPIIDGPDLNLAVFPGGGVNAYTSLYSAKLFVDKMKNTDPARGIYNSFDQAWGLSGGSIVASMLMLSHRNNENGAVAVFEATVTASFNQVKQIIDDLLSGNATAADPLDGNGGRRGLFQTELNKVAGINGINFGNLGTKKLVIIAAELTSKKPVYYAHQSLVIPKDSLRASNITPVTTAIINSSNFQPGISLGKEGGLFQIVADTLMPANKPYRVIDGAHVNQLLDDGIRAVSKNHPLGLAIDYLKKIRPDGRNGKREHQVVVFDNGSGPGVYANKFKFNNGYAKYEEDGVIINIYFIAVKDDSFDDRTHDIRTPPNDPHNSFQARQDLVDIAIAAGGPSKKAFDDAAAAITATSMR